MKDRRRRLGAAGIALAAGLVLAGCGGGAPAPEAGADQSSAPAAADPARFCQANVDLEASLATGPPIDFETASEEEIMAALQEYGRTVEPLVVEVEQAAPPEVAEDVGTQARLLRQALETGDDSVFESPEFAAANQAVDGYMLDSCGYEQVQVTTVDHEYEGLPESLPTGVVAVTMTNEGEEQHMLGLLRINDDVTASLDELLALPEEEGMQMATFLGAAFAPLGEADTIFVELAAGRHAAVCFLPEGSIGDQEGTGPPHFTLGMQGEITVT